MKGRKNYGRFSSNNNSNIFSSNIVGSDSNQEVDKILRSSGLFEQMMGKNFNEYLGEYQKASDSGVSSENKEVYRIITYVEVPQNQGT